MLALSFLIVVGVVLVAEGVGFTSPQGLHLLRHGLLGGGGDARHCRIRGVATSRWYCARPDAP
jgi:hypothetical protein